MASISHDRTQGLARDCWSKSGYGLIKKWEAQLNVSQTQNLGIVTKIFQDTNVTLGHCTDCKSSDTHWNAATRLERNLLDVHKRKCLCINHGLIADWITLDGLDAQICNPSSPSSWFFLRALSSVPGLMLSDEIKVLYHHVLWPLRSVVFCLYFLFSFLYFWLFEGSPPKSSMASVVVTEVASPQVSTLGWLMCHLVIQSLIMYVKYKKMVRWFVE